MDLTPRIDRTELALAAACVVGLALAALIGGPWAVFVAAMGMAALFGALLHWLTRRDRHRRHLDDVAAGRGARPKVDPRAQKRRQRH